MNTKKFIYVRGYVYEKGVNPLNFNKNYGKFITALFSSILLIALNLQLVTASSCGKIN